MTRAFFLMTLAAAPALAWESTCSKFTNKTLEPDDLRVASRQPCEPSAGPATARERWIGPGDEHRELFELTRSKAGLPFEVSATQNLAVFTADGMVDLGGGTNVATFVPSAPGDITRVAYRSYSIGEFSQLPDFSYGLWDWASGHEVCPIAGSESVAECHDFAAHMGPVNSNHFLPQARTNYAHYHALALARAADCAQLGQKLAMQPRFTSYVRACELEALSLEAIGQHFLQDSWSMGHMWERWGSATLEDFPGATVEEKRDRAVLTALVSGFFHGARSVLQALPAWTTYDVNDAMCAPWDEVKFTTLAGATSNGIGDNYLDLLRDDAKYAAQAIPFFQCAVSGLLEVYMASGQQHGVAMPEPGFVSIDPTSDACFGQRATNAAIAAGAAVNLKLAGAQITIPVDARFVSLMIPKVARSSGKVAVEPKLRNEFRFELQRAVTRARLKAKDDPDGTELASGEWGTFMGVQPNGAYDRVATYLDATWPWDPMSERTQFLQRTFHRAHATELCAQIDLSALDALRVRAHDLNAPIEEQVAACTACSELAVRHLRVGLSSSNYDTANEPLCTALVTSPAYLYAQFPGFTDPTATASQWCCQ